METKHTPGPWTIAPSYPDANLYRLWDKNGNFHDDTSVDTMNANARLIAAAPDLLAVLEQIADEMQSAASSGESVNQAWLERRIKRARAVIAKATGN